MVAGVPLYESLGTSSEYTVLTCPTPYRLSSLRMALAKGQILVSHISAILNADGSILLPVPIDEITGTPASAALTIMLTFASTSSTASTI